MSTHDCIKRVNEHLAKHNTQISTAISFSEPERELIQVGTCKADAGKRGKVATMWATFCPFCGCKLATKKKGTQP